MASAIALIARPVREVMTAPAPVVDAAAACSAAIDAMISGASSCVLVADPTGAIAGIVTERDVTRRIAFRADADAPIGDAMTAPVHTANADDFLYQAIGTMRRHALRHLPVVDAEGSVVGMLHLRDALADASAEIVAQIDALVHEGSLDGLAAAKSAEAEVAAALLEDGIPPEDIQELISHVNGDICRRVTEAAMAALAAEGTGPAPAPFAVIVMGSGGRGESSLSPDQDNGFIIGDYPDDQHGRIDGWFTALAERMTRDLAAVGFPLCRGGVMATNPLWRKTLPQWREQTRLWARRRGTAAVRLGDIFFDFAPVCGDLSLAAALRRHVTGLMRGNTAFLLEINRDQVQHHSALGLFGRFVVEGGEGPFRGWINVKLGGTLPLVNAVRLLALREGVAETSTHDRIRELARIGALSPDEAEDAASAFRHMSFVLLRQQTEAMTSGAPVGNHVPPRRLSRRERRLLKDAFRCVDALHDRVGGEMTGNVLTGETAMRMGA